jgi:hypothetical protein
MYVAANSSKVKDSQERQERNRLISFTNSIQFADPWINHVLNLDPNLIAGGCKGKLPKAAMTWKEVVESVSKKDRRRLRWQTEEIILRG